MGKKEFLDKIDKEGPVLTPQKSGIFGKLFGITKFILGICLLPFVYSSTIAFLNELSVLEKIINYYFFSGIISFLVIYLFIYEPAIIYNKGHKILEGGFRFFTPLVRVAPYLLPIYTIIFFLLCVLLLWINRQGDSIRYFVFLFGFSVALHLVFSAKTLRRRQNDFLKGNYIFGFSFVYIINLTLLALFLNLIFKEFSIVNFLNNTFSSANSLFYSLFKQLFLR